MSKQKPSVRAGDIILTIIALYLGVFLIYVGGWGGWGLLWAMIGLLFTVVGFGSGLLTLGSLDLPISPALRRGGLRLVILFLVIALLAVTFLLAVTGKGM